MRPNTNEYGAYYQGYINNVPAGTIVENLKKSIAKTKAIVLNIPESKGDYAYAAGKWTIKELLLHMIDVERVMSYRALCVARNDKTAFPGFDHDNYVVESGASARGYIIIGHETHHMNILNERYL